MNYFNIKRYIFLKSVFMSKTHPCPRHEGLQVEQSTESLILNLSTRWRYVISFMSWPLYLRERTPVPN
jgi:hypothetical protein